MTEFFLYFDDILKNAWYGPIYINTKLQHSNMIVYLLCTIPAIVSDQLSNVSHEYQFSGLTESLFSPAFKG